MNKDIWTIILSYIGIEEMTKMAIINKLFYEIIQSQLYLNNLSKLDQYILFGKACKYGRYQYILKLLSNINPDFCDNYCIKKASKNGHHEVVKLLLNNLLVNPSARDQYTIRWASRNGYIKIVKLLLNDQRVDPSVRDQYAIRWASYNNYIGTVKLLLKDNRVNGCCALYCASSAGNHQIVKYILNNVYTRLTELENALTIASKNNYPEVVKLLLNDPRIDPSADNQCAVKQASNGEYIEVLKLLLKDHRVDPHIYKNAVIHAVIRSNDLKAIKILLNNNQINVSQEGQYLFDLSLQYNNVEAIKLLLYDYHIVPGKSSFSKGNKEIKKVIETYELEQYLRKYLNMVD